MTNFMGAVRISYAKKKTPCGINKFADRVCCASLKEAVIWKINSVNLPIRN